MNTEEIHLLNGVLPGDRMAADEFVHRYSRFIYLVIHEGPLPPLKPLPSGGLGSVEIGTDEETANPQVCLSIASTVSAQALSSDAAGASS